MPISHMSAASVKLPNWGAGFRAPAMSPCADFLQTSSLGSDLLTAALVCLGGAWKYMCPGESSIFEKIENKKINLSVMESERIFTLCFTNVLDFQEVPSRNPYAKKS